MPEAGPTTISVPSPPPLDRTGFALAVTIWFTVPATLLDVVVAGGIRSVMDENHPWLLQLALRPIVGVLLTQLIWPTWSLVRASMLAVWLGFLLVGVDLFFATFISQLWTWGLAKPAPSWLMWCGGRLWLIHFSLVALFVRHHVRRRRRLRGS